MDTNTRSVSTFGAAPHRIMPDPGAVLLKEGLAKEALPFLLEAHRREPNEWRHSCNLGVAYRILGDLESGKHYFKKALDSNHQAYPIWLNFAVLLDDLGDFTHSFQAYQAAFQLQPHDQKVAMGWATALFREGRWKEAWTFWEFGRFNQSYRACEIPQWSGEPLDGKKILVTPEGGYGDFINYLPYARKLKDMGAKVSVLTWDRLIPLLEEQGWLDHIYPRSAPREFPDIDYVVSVCSLPGCFELEPDTIKPEIPYLKVNEKLVEEYAKRLPKGTKIGFCWSAEEACTARKHRSMTTEEAGKLVTRNHNWISLQYKETPPEGVLQFPDMVDGWDKTAALVSLCDLVITVDTAIGHLAGALGKPCWLLLGVNHDWRWLRNRTDSVWYPTMRIFRETKPLTWGNVIRDVREALCGLD